LLGDLYGWLNEPERLQRFLAKVGHATGSHVGALFRQDFANPTASGLVSMGVSVQEMARFEGEYAAENIWMQRTHERLRAGSVFFSDDWVARSELRQTRYYAEYLRSIDVEHSVGICGYMQRERCAMLTFCRSAHSGPYDDDARRLLEKLAPHFTNAYGLLTKLEQWRTLATRQEGRGRAMFLLDERLNWIDGNAAAEDCVAAGWWRGRRGGPLAAVHGITAVAWRSLQRELAGGALPQRTIPVHDAQGALVAFACLHACGAAAPGTGMPSLILFVRGVEPMEASGLGEQVREMFGLTTAEAQLALSLRRSGELSNAAAAVGIAESSARTRLQAVFEKTGTHRQIELLRMLDALAETLH
jgi:hypothetical protein